LEATIPFLPQCYPLLFFYVHCTLEIHSAGEKLHSVLDDLEQVFPGPEPTGEEEEEEGYEDIGMGGTDEEGGGCSIIKGLRALVYYHVRGESSTLIPLSLVLIFGSIADYSCLPSTRRL
jgi:anaphase-promoting complex subunit 8